MLYIKRKFCSYNEYLRTSALYNRFAVTTNYFNSLESAMHAVVWGGESIFHLTRQACLPWTIGKGVEVINTTIIVRKLLDM